MSTLRAFGVPLLAFLLAGCVSVGLGGKDDDPVIRFHTMDGAVSVPRAASAAATSVALREFMLRDRYEPRVIIRTSDATVEFLDLERWADEPREAISIAFAQALAESGTFAQVVPAGYDHPADLILEGTVLRFDLEDTAAGPWRARFEVRLHLSRIGSGELLHSAVYDTTRDLPGRAATGLGPAMGGCVADALAQAIADWRKAGILP